MNTAPFSVGRYLVESLAANGIDTVFGIPGVHTLELYRGLAGARLTHVLVRHEQNAGFAADGYARASGRPAAAFVISGPGLTNIMTAMGQAYSDSVPMLVVASTPVQASLGRGWGVLHELKDQRALAAGVAGIARSASSAEEVRTSLREVFASFAGGRARPAYLEVPLDLLAKSTTLRPERFEQGGSRRAAADAAGIDRAAALLSTSRRPLIIVGGGARAAGTVVGRLVERLDAYLVSSAAGKGVLFEHHAANLGGSLQFHEIQKLIATADVVLAVGTELSETDVYTRMHLKINGKLIRIDIDPHKLSDHYAADVAILGDAQSTLESLAQRLTQRTGWRTEEGPAAIHRLRIETGFDARSRAAGEALRAIRAALPADGIVCSDMTQIAYLGNYAFDTDHPGTWLHPSGFGALGFALPAAIGAKLADPQRAVIALAGDYGVQFTLQELMTAVELQLSLPVIVWNNSALGQIRDDMLAAKIPPLGVEARNPDFIALARACAAEGVRASGPRELTAATTAALARRGPTLIEVNERDFLSAQPAGRRQSPAS